MSSSLLLLLRGSGVSLQQFLASSGLGSPFPQPPPARLPQALYRVISGHHQALGGTDV